NDRYNGLSEGNFRREQSMNQLGGDRSASPRGYQSDITKISRSLAMTLTNRASREVVCSPGLPGLLMLLVGIALFPLGIWQMIAAGVAMNQGGTDQVLRLLLGIACLPAAAFVLRSLVLVNPNVSKVVLLFGKYQGTLRRNGFFSINPLT